VNFAAIQQQLPCVRVEGDVLEAIGQRLLPRIRQST
jgi:hypothetical protein